MSASDIYDFEGIVEGACSVILTAAGLVAWSPQRDPVLQKERPRVELIYTHGAGQNIWSLNVGGTGYVYRREAAFKGTLRLDIITAADIKQHTSYRSQVRSVVASLWNKINSLSADDVPWQYSVNGQPTDGKLRNHKLQFSGDAGTSAIAVSPEEGFMRSSLTFNTDLSIQANAWTLLDT